MIILITGATHTGKTVLSQNILEKYHYPYLSIDLLKMGLIRSGYTNLVPEDDVSLQTYLWPVVREMLNTAIENGQNLIVEGGYIPFGWEESFPPEYLKEIRYYCLVMSRQYIENHFSDIKRHACKIEQRIDDSWCTKQYILEENEHYLEMCRKYKYKPVLIDETYTIEIDLVNLHEL